MENIYRELAAAAVAARGSAYCPYSRFQVGAALLTAGGKVYTGCNIESAAYGPSNCAERTAIFKAVSEGERQFEAIAISGAPEGGEADYCYPCGVCRQVMMEFVEPGAFDVIIAKTADDFRVHKFGELLPFGFGPKDLERTAP